MNKIDTGLDLGDLDSWGRVTDLGCELLEGEGRAFGRATLAAPDQPTHAAYFGVEKGRFRMTYPFTEQATVIRGEVTITDTGTGRATRFRPGDSWVVEKGTTTVWEVHTPGFIKHYLAVA